MLFLYQCQLITCNTEVGRLADYTIGLIWAQQSDTGANVTAYNCWMLARVYISIYVIKMTKCAPESMINFENIPNKK